MTTYHSLQECFFERLPGSPETLPNLNDTDTANQTPEQDAPSLSEEQVSLLAKDLARTLSNYPSDLPD